MSTFKEISINELKGKFNEYTRFIARPDGSMTITTLKGGKKGGEDNVSCKKNKQEDGISFKHPAKKRLKNMLISAAMNGKFANKNTVWATFTFPPSDEIPAYRDQVHDKILFDVFHKCIVNMTQNYGLQDYVFVAERHEGERTNKGIKPPKGSQSHLGWLHFHTILLFDKFVDVQMLNYLWLKYTNKYLNCKIISHENYLRISERLMAHDKELVFDLLNQHDNYTDFDDYMRRNPVFDVKVFCKSYLQIISTAYTNNDLQALCPILYVKPSPKARGFSKIIYNPFEAEFFQGSFNEHLKHVIAYINKYITQSNNELIKNTNDDQETEVSGTLIYCRIWQATRVFTQQIIKSEVSKEFFETLDESAIYKIVETEIEMYDKDTGEIKPVPVYSVIYSYDIYQNQEFIKLFLDDSNKQANSQFLRAFNTDSTKKKIRHPRLF